MPEPLDVTHDALTAQPDWPPELVAAIAQAVVDKLQAEPEFEDKPLQILNYPRYLALSQARQWVSGIAAIALVYALSNCFMPLLPQPFWLWHLILALGAIASGLALVILLVIELLRGAGTDQEIQRSHGSKIIKDYQFIPSLNRFSAVLSLLILGLSTILLGFATLYAELVRHNPDNFVGLTAGFLSIYFSLVTFSTVGYGDIYPVSVVARLAAVCEIFMAMFFSLVVISSTLSWVIAHKRQQQDSTIKERIQAAQKQASEDLTLNPSPKLGEGL